MISYAVEIRILQDCFQQLIRSDSVMDILIRQSKECIGEMTFSEITGPLGNNDLSLPPIGVKRPAPRNQQSVVKRAAVAPIKGNFEALHNDLTQMGLMPEISNSDLSCKMCNYTATQKTHLKTHYKLKHFGGADLIMKCQICEITIKTKSAIKKHYMKVHNLNDVAASNMAATSNA